MENQTGKSEGKIVRYFGPKGFGFIAPADWSKDIFFHVSRCDDALVSLMDTDIIGVEVVATWEQKPLGRSATSVWPVSNPQQEDAA